MTTNKTITAAELARGARIQVVGYKGAYDVVAAVANNGLCVTVELADGRTQYYRPNFRLEVAS